MDLLKDSFQTAASMSAANLGFKIDTVADAYAAAMGPQLKDVCGPSIAEQFHELTGMKQIRETIRQLDQVPKWTSGDLASGLGQAVLKEMARQNDLSRIVDRCLALDHLRDFETVGRFAAAANAPWFETSDLLRRQAEAWPVGGGRSADTVLREALGKDVASQLAGILERETRAWDAWAGHWQDPLQGLVSRVAVSGAGAALTDCLNPASRVDFQAMFEPAVDARQMICDAIGQLGTLGYAAYEEQARRAFDDILRPFYRWADSEFDRDQFRRQEQSRTTFKPDPTPGGGELLTETPARLGRLRAFVWQRLRAMNLPYWVATFVVGALGNVAGNVAGTEYGIWRTHSAAPPAPAVQATAPAPAPSVQPNVENAIVVTARNLSIRQGPNAKERSLVTVEYGQVLRVLKLGAKQWAVVEYIDPNHNGVQIVGWVDTALTKRVDRDTLRLLWCGMTADASKLDLCRRN